MRQSERRIGQVASNTVARTDLLADLLAVNKGGGMTETRTAVERRKRIRIFHLEDDEVERNGIRIMCDLTPESDLIYAGAEVANTSDLGDKVAEARADVAIVDLAFARHAKHNIEQILSGPSTSGLFAVAALHKRFGRRLKIMSLTNYPEYTHTVRWKPVPTP